MKNKVVIWGTNANEEKVLIALELKADANKVMLYTFPEALADDEFVNKMMNEWREGKEVEFPEGYTALERELSVTESLLPDDLKVDRSDIIQRAQTEWHFAVLSAKLHAAYQQELAEFKEKIEALSTYDNKIWDGLKAFWDKVQSQSRERNLFREHADNLRDNINALFDEMKQLRSKVQGEFVTASQSLFEDFNKILDEVDEKIAAGSAKLGSIFEELKQIQRRYRDARLTNEHRNILWDRIDGAFKKAKERKFGPSANEGSVSERHERRLNGLLEAMKRMESSIRRDEDELNFQQKKINSSEGQLEAQIRTAKIKMIEERLASKREKLAEMDKTKTEVERQVKTAREKEARRAEKEEEKQKIESAKEAIKSEIAAEIKAKKEEEGDLLDAASSVIGDALMSALDSARAVASVAADKVEEAVEKAVDKAEEMLESISTKEDAGKAGDKKDIIVDDVVQQSGAAGEEGMESFKESSEEKAPEKKDIIVDDVVQQSGAAANEGMESFNAGEENAPGKKKDIIVDDVVQQSGAAADEGMESFNVGEENAPGKKKDIIVDDVVQNTGAEETGGLESVKEAPAKPKRTTKKKDA
ncbi:MAG: hypothetical protein H6565_03145 [Lewinellaceae bacterium]|nr:hypothetical protein [Lewinellaceae bacterium]